MDILHCLQFKRNITVWDRDEECPLPPWAASLIWLGYWCRLTQLHGKRLIVFAILPTRDLAASFAAVGALLGGARAFKDSLSWPRFREMPIGSVVHWKETQSGAKFSGIISAFREEYGTEFISLKVTRPVRRATAGLVTSISRNVFDNYLFTQEAPPTSARSTAFGRSENLVRSLLGDLNPKWAWAEGPESILVTRMTAFGDAMADLSLSCDGSPRVAMTELLCAARSNEAILAKLHISHPRGNLDGRYPLAILDGAEPFDRVPHLPEAANLLTILDRSEFSQEIKDQLLRLSHVFQIDELGEIPAEFPHGIELAAYVVPLTRI